MLLALLTALSLGAAPVDLSTPPTVVLVPLGEVDDAALQAIREGITAHARVSVRVDPVRPLPPQAFYAPRKRWRAEKILDALDADPPKDAWKVVAVTAAEISTTKGDIKDWGIGGLGNIGGKSCVVSTFLVRKHTPRAGQAKYARRMAELGVHEFGHTLGLDHCPTPGCVMSDAQGRLIRSLDASSGEFCDRCRHQLQEGLLQIAVRPTAPGP
jgi:archaemetzincin